MLLSFLALLVLSILLLRTSPLYLSLPIITVLTVLSSSNLKSSYESLISYLLFRTNKFKRFFWLQVYNKLASKNQSDSWKCMNYGYAEEKGPFIESNSEEIYCLQLYHFIASGMFSFKSLESKSVLEVGSGRGGGLEYVLQTFNPDKVIGVDYCQKQVDLCNEFYSGIKKLKFVQGDAENLGMKDESFDVVINVESSHCYGKIDRFFAEVFRVLKEDGVFLYTDFMKPEEATRRENVFKTIGFKIIKKKDITGNIIRSMDLENKRKVDAITKFSKFTRYFLDQFVGLQTSKVYKVFKDREWVYMAYYLTRSN